MAVHAESSIQLNTIPAYTSLLGGHFIYKSTVGTQEHPTPPSANVIEIATTPSNPSTWGYNTHIGANGIKLRYNEIDLSTWTNTGLIFYNLGLGNTNNKSIELNSSGLYLYRPLTVGESGPQPTAAQLTATGLNITEGSITLGNNFQVDSEGNLYANNADISGKITVASGSNVYTKTEAAEAFDANGAAAQAESNAVATASADATSKANAAQAAAEANAAADATSKANAVNTALETYKTNTNSTLTNLQNQVDGQVEVWYYSVDPTTSNPPASSWDTDTLKARHEGDLYYNINSGHSWRWLKNGTTYSWQRIPDGDAAAALAKATEAATLAGNKRRIFTTQPTPPYDVGDLWVNGSQVKYCNTSKVDGDSYAASDWVLTATDDTKANTAVYEEQYIYISKASGTTSVSQYTTWVTRADDVQNTWTTKRPTYNTSYPVLFVAKQKKTVSQSGGDTCTCTTPIKDDTTTIIDGGHITTGTIDAARINATDLIANNSIVVGSQIEDFVTQQDIDDTIEVTTVNDLSDGSQYTKTSDLGNTTAVQNAARTASNYLGDTDSDAGVTLKAKNGTTTDNTSTSNYIKINSSGLNIYKAGISIAQYGDTARIGNAGSTHFLINAASLQAYDNSNNLYFEVAANGIKFGSNLNQTVATEVDIATQQKTINDLSSTTAERFDSTNTAISNAQASIDEQKNWFYHDGNGSHIVGKTSGYQTDIDEYGMRITNSSTQTTVSEFSLNNVRIGKQNESNVHITNQRFEMNEGGNTVAYLEGERFKTGDAQITNLYMKTYDANDQSEVGALGWVMRSNGHLSLRRLK